MAFGFHNVTSVSAHTWHIIALGRSEYFSFLVFSYYEKWLSVHLKRKVIDHYRIHFLGIRGPFSKRTWPSITSMSSRSQKLFLSGNWTENSAL